MIDIDWIIGAVGIVGMIVVIALEVYKWII
jgi:hypothetical protein